MARTDSSHSRCCFDRSFGRLPLQHGHALIAQPSRSNPSGSSCSTWSDVPRFTAAKANHIHDGSLLFHARRILLRASFQQSHPAQCFRLGGPHRAIPGEAHPVGNISSSEARQTRTAGGGERAELRGVQVESEADLDTSQRSEQVGPGAADGIRFLSRGRCEPSGEPHGWDELNGVASAGESVTAQLLRPKCLRCVGPKRVRDSGLGAQVTPTLCTSGPAGGGFSNHNTDTASRKAMPWVRAARPPSRIDG